MHQITPSYPPLYTIIRFWIRKGAKVNSNQFVMYQFRLQLKNLPGNTLDNPVMASVLLFASFLGDRGNEMDIPQNTDTKSQNPTDQGNEQHHRQSS